MYLFLAFTTVDYWFGDVPLQYRFTIIPLPWPADVSAGVH